MGRAPESSTRTLDHCADQQPPLGPSDIEARNNHTDAAELYLICTWRRSLSPISRFDPIDFPQYSGFRAIFGRRVKLDSRRLLDQRGAIAPPSALVLALQRLRCGV